jgi:hypothetical protein
MREIRLSGLGGRGSALRSSYPHLQIVPDAIDQGVEIVGDARRVVDHVALSPQFQPPEAASLLLQLRED